MEDLTKLLLVLLILMVLPLVGTTIGAFCGLMVGIFWPSTMLQGMTALGMGSMVPYQFGAFLGFCGGFFKAVVAK